MRHDPGREDPELARAIRTLPVPTVLIDLEGSALLWNLAAAALLGWEEAPRPPGSTARAFAAPDAAILGYLRDAVSQQGHARLTVRRRVGGRIRHFRIHAAAVYDREDTLEGLVLVLTERSDGVRARRRAMRLRGALEASQQRFRLLSDGVRDHAIIMLDADGRISSWNPGAELLTGYGGPDAMQQHISLLYGEEDRAAGKPAEQLQEARAGARREVEGWWVRKDGGRFWGGITLVALRGPGGEAKEFACVLRDLTERREREEALRRSESQLRQAQKMEAIGRLAGGIAHDFNNLLTAIQGHTQFLLEDLPEAAGSRADAEEIKRAADRAAALTRQLLTFSRSQPVEPQALEMNSVIAEMEKLLRRVIREDIALAVTLDPDLWKVFADRGQLEQVIMNLVVNARDAMPGGGTLTIATHNVHVDEDYAIPEANLAAGPHVQLVVSDTGVGMDRETLSRIFEPFFTTKAAGEGTGLGLATVYSIVKHSSGHISAYSEKGRGTTFKMYLPKAETASDQEERKAVARPVQSSTATGATILLVEDDQAVRGLASRILQKGGYVLLEAANGQEALRMAREHSGAINLLLTDVVMPEMSGRTLAGEVALLHPATRVVYMSGFTKPDAVRQGLVESQSKYIEKPFSPDDFLRAVQDGIQ